mgnify:CR=1 FL=1
MQLRGSGHSCKNGVIESIGSLNVTLSVLLHSHACRTSAVNAHVNNCKLLSSVGTLDHCKQMADQLASFPRHAASLRVLTTALSSLDALGLEVALPEQ